MTFFRLLALLFRSSVPVVPLPRLQDEVSPFVVDYRMSVPRVTVITVVLNAVADLEKTIRSVTEQKYPNLEYVVIDGGSRDGTLELLRHSPRVNYWVSESDNGISDAFNKGILASSGEWINFLNAGDVFSCPDIVGQMVEKGASGDIVTGYVRYGANKIPNCTLRNTDVLHRRAWISHQGSFVRRRVFFDVGMFRPQFRVRMDYEFWLRALRSREFIFVDEMVGHYSAGVSARAIGAFYWEELVANKINLGGDWRRDLLVVYSYLGRAYRELRGRFLARL